MYLIKIVKFLNFIISNSIFIINLIANYKNQLFIYFYYLNLSQLKILGKMPNLILLIILLKDEKLILNNLENPKSLLKIFLISYCIFLLTKILTTFCNFYGENFFIK